MTKSSFDEIASWKEFEELIADYFADIQKNEGNNIIDVFVNPSGVGADGGKDILVEFTVKDSIVSYKRTWVIQCKFYGRDLKKSDLNDINIPTLIHENKADGYLLICKNDVTSGVKLSFENLNNNCKFGYSYQIWNGSNLKNKILGREDLLKKYFPKYFSSI